MDWNQYDKLTEKEIIKIDSNKEIVVWGIGEGVYGLLKRNSRSVSCFIDKKAKKHKMTFFDLPVYPPEYILNKNVFVIVSLCFWNRSIVDFLKQNKISNKKILYIAGNGGFYQDDSSYKGCFVGRGTYGYESLMEREILCRSIGRYCSINETARIVENHLLSAVTTSPIIENEIIPLSNFYKNKNRCLPNSKRINSKVTIGNDVWIGYRVIICQGITIGDGAIIGAGAVVTKDVAPYTIVGGIPAKAIRKRFSNEIIAKFLKIKWWDWSLEKINANLELFYQPEKFIKKFYQE